MIIDFVKKAEKVLGKKRMEFVSSITHEADLMEVNLKHPYMHTLNDEISWLYGDDYEDTQVTVFKDLVNWFNLHYIQKVTVEKLESIGVFERPTDVIQLSLKDYDRRVLVLRHLYGNKHWLLFSQLSKGDKFIDKDGDPWVKLEFFNCAKAALENESAEGSFYFSDNALVRKI